MLDPEPCGISAVIWHNGWAIWCWTGWGGPVDRLSSKWLAAKGTCMADSRYLEVCVDNLDYTLLVGGEYKLEDHTCFGSVGGVPITVSTTESAKEDAQKAGLRLMYRLIDQLEGVAAPSQVTEAHKVESE